MNFDTWEPVYEAILAGMGYDRAADERARDVLRDLTGDTVPIDPAEHSFEGATVAIAAPGPSLDATDDRLDRADRIVAAGVAADRLVGSNVSVDWIVSDLDGHSDRIARFTADGVPVAVHAHGDNVDLVREHVPAMDHAAVLPTTQAAPAGAVRNLGGFTDGDRAAFLADELGADRLTFPGWDLDDPSVGAEKRRKLAWAERLLRWLEFRRGECFDLLDGRRDAIDLSMVPDAE